MARKQKEPEPEAVQVEFERSRTLNRPDKLVRDHQIIQLWMDGASIQETAIKVGCSDFTVKKARERARQEFKSERIADMEALVSEQLALLTSNMRRAIKAFRQSQRPVMCNGLPTYDENGDQVFASAGDPRFLAVINEITKQKAELLGMNAPKAIDLNMFVSEEDLRRLDSFGIKNTSDADLFLRNLGIQGGRPN